MLSGDAPMMIKSGTSTVASLLKQAGYATAIIGKWCLGLGDGRPDWNGTTRPGTELLTLRATHGHDMAIVNGIGRIGYLRGGQSALWEEANIADALVWQATTGS